MLKKYFDIRELVCEDVYKAHKENAWSFLDPRLLEVLLFARTNLNKPITINNWHRGGTYRQRGLRCNMCQLVRTKTKLYMSAHILGMAIDFEVSGMSAEAVRNWIYNNRERLPYPVRLESGVSWVHLDVRTDSAEHVVYFKG